MKKTLGGDRLGAGKGMQVELREFSRSTHDPSKLWRSSMSVGTLVPFMKKLVNNGDTWDIDLNAFVNTHPTIGPLFGSMKLQLDIFWSPLRLYLGKLHNNKMGIGMKMNTVKFPILRLNAQPTVTGLPDVDNSQINPSCILKYLGIRGIGRMFTGTTKSRDFNAIPYLAFWEIYKNYYSNKQEDIGAVIHRPSTSAIETITSIEIDGEILPNTLPSPGIQMVAGTMIEVTYAGTFPSIDQVFIHLGNGTVQALTSLATVISQTATTISLSYLNVTWGDQVALYWNYNNGQIPVQQPIGISTFPLENIDAMRDAILLASTNAAAFNVNETNLAPYEYILDSNQGSIMSSQEGLPLKTYQSDMYQNWLKTEWIDGPNGINEITKIDTTDGLKIDTLVLQRKVYDMLNAVAVSGGTYNDWLSAVYGNERQWQCESPMYIGGLSKEIVFQEVISNSEAAANGSSTQPLGTLAGKGTLSNKHKGGRVSYRADEPGYLIGIVSITPRIDYSQGNDFDVHLQTMDDLFKPALNEIGFQESLNEQRAWWDTHWSDTDGWVQTSAGKVPAWLNYMTDTNSVYGNFAMKGNEDFMVLTRRYQEDLLTGRIKDLTTYIDPTKFNHIFAQTSIDSQNFWVQIGMDITLRSKVSYKQMPNL